MKTDYDSRIDLVVSSCLIFSFIPLMLTSVLAANISDFFRLSSILFLNSRGIWIVSVANRPYFQGNGGQNMGLLLVLHFFVRLDL